MARHIIALGLFCTIGGLLHAFVPLSGADHAALRFTLWQSVLSACATVLCAVPLARALVRQSFWGRGALIMLFGAPFIMPVLVALLGLIIIFGRFGPVNMVLGMIGITPVSIYGPGGIILAHIFLNLAFVTRMLLQGWTTIPAERIRLAQSLGFGPRDYRHHIERPMLTMHLPALWMMVFILCLTGFTTVLVLGGGPQATTIELAIYQAVRLSFDLPKAYSLALWQLWLGLGALGCAAIIRQQGNGPFGLYHMPLWPVVTGWRKYADYTIISMAGLFLLSPLVVIVAKGIYGLPALPAAIWPSIIGSVTIGLFAAPVAVTLAIILAFWRAQGQKGIEFLVMLPMALSPLITGILLFFISFQTLSMYHLAFVNAILANIILTLPFAYRIIAPNMQNIWGHYGRLTQSMGIKGWGLWRWLLWPQLRSPILFALGICAALSMGDLGAIILFSDNKVTTLPLLIQRLMGSYQINGAAGAALILIMLILGIFFLCDRWGQHYAKM